MNITYYARCVEVENIPARPEPPEWRIISFTAGSTKFEIAQPIRSLNYFKPGRMYRVSLTEDE